ncbi:MAG: pantoate--beta-alanine ligase [Flavobacteriaceae bacterium]
MFTRYKEIQELLENHSGSVGLVPTMGALHKGHLTLVQKAIQENDYVVVSIFINPTQFNNPKDLENYPNNLIQDQVLLERVSKSLYIYAPETVDLYPSKVIAKKYHFGSIASQMEGVHRPGHFNGMATVVEALLKKVQPQKAYFGEKDFQQLQIVKALNDQLNLNVQIVGCPVVRELDGLAMSSRNQLLNNQQRTAAPVIFKTLQLLQSKRKTWNVDQMEAFFKSTINESKSLKVDYFYIANETDLVPVKKLKPMESYRFFVAVYAGKTRLIDTLELKRI